MEDEKRKPKVKIIVAGEAGSGKTAVATMISVFFQSIGVPEINMVDDGENVDFWKTKGEDMGTWMGKLFLNGLEIEVETQQTQREPRQH